MIYSTRKMHIFWFISFVFAGFLTIVPFANAEPLPRVSLSAYPETITSGENSALSWTSINATSCIASEGWRGYLSRFGARNINPKETTGYIVVCTGAGGSASARVVVTVIDESFPLPAVNSAASGVNYGTPGGSAGNVTNATYASVQAVSGYFQDNEAGVNALCVSRGYGVSDQAQLSNSDAADDGDDDKALLASAVYGGGGLPPGMGLFLVLIAIIIAVLIGAVAFHRMMQKKQRELVLQEQQMTA